MQEAIALIIGLASLLCARGNRRKSLLFRAAHHVCVNLSLTNAVDTGLSATDAWHRAESVMGHIQHLSFESLVKMDHFQKEPPLNLKGTTGAQGGSKGASTHPKKTDRKSGSD